MAVHGKNRDMFKHIKEPNTINLSPRNTQDIGFKEEIVEELGDIANWRPNYSRIAKKLGINKHTCRYKVNCILKRMQENGR